jgi:hypothetical protein
MHKLMHYLQIHTSYQPQILNFAPFWQLLYLSTHNLKRLSSVQELLKF